MLLISYSRHQFPPVVIQHAVWLYLRFTLSYRDVEDLLAERGLDISYETIRRWVRSSAPCSREGCGRDARDQARAGTWTRWLVQKRRNKAAAVKLMRKLLKKHGFAPSVIVTDKLRSYSAARAEIGLSARHEQGQRRTDEMDKSFLPERAIFLWRGRPRGEERDDGCKSRLAA